MTGRRGISSCWKLPLSPRTQEELLSKPCKLSLQQPSSEAEIPLDLTFQRSRNAKRRSYAHFYVKGISRDQLKTSPVSTASLPKCKTPTKKTLWTT